MQPQLQAVGRLPSAANQIERELLVPLPTAATAGAAKRRPYTTGTVATARPIASQGQLNEELGCEHAHRLAEQLACTVHHHMQHETWGLCGATARRLLEWAEGDTTQQRIAKRAPPQLATQEPVVRHALAVRCVCAVKGAGGIRRC